MDKILNQNTVVQFTLENKRILGKVVGIAMQSQPVIGPLYIIEPFQRIENYEYSHVALFRSQLITAIETE